MICAITYHSHYLLIPSLWGVSAYFRGDKHSVYSNYSFFPQILIPIYLYTNVFFGQLILFYFLF